MKYAFTLSEVLITLGVIGVVASITMPALIQNYQKSQTINKLKASYSLLNNAIDMAKIDNGLDVNEWYFPAGEKAEISDYFADHYLIPYLKVIKDDCKAVDGCSISYKWLNGQETTRTNTRVFVLSNGTAIIAEAHKSDDISQANGKFRAQIFLLINGLKKNNVMGRDIFMIELGGTGVDKNKFLPYMYSYSAGSFNTAYACNKNDTGNGCLGLIMKQGWQITKDYPW